MFALPTTNTHTHTRARARAPQKHPAGRRADTRYSAAAFAAWAALFLPWLLLFAVGGPAIVGEAAYRRLDVSQLDIAQLQAALARALGSHIGQA